MSAFHRAAFFVIVLQAAAVAQPPRTLPTPEVPLELAPSQRGPAQPYVGPPAGIDGPEELPSLEATSPDIAIDEAPLFEDLFDGTLFAPQQKLNPYKDGFFQKLSLSAGWMGNS